ncbi:Uncharacterized membrane protein YphA, DoxX/SURF4 family [Chitinophaga eiseniae]|uniref:Uncharacterized membrane protein YphA, DoxX/SURF4 family n=1 Tax=Chitinophaga eiseniae TaxID=634771 RepID=A0A1T4SR58_9BACT|nr:DoxX family protein [Chitinophaga eiseniae]SKA30744.1 Uncharacterized membrane protein YphA, DoxX/SURF4 family [Chitinophaga eiseniae]
MKSYQDIAALLLRLSLGAGFLSAVASRLNLWGSRSSGWHNFLQYTAQVNSFAPPRIIPAIAVVATILEASLGIMLLTGYKTQLAAVIAMGLTLLFALAMTYSYGLKEPLDYSVFAFSAGAFLLATIPSYRWSIDQLLNS